MAWPIGAIHRPYSSPMLVWTPDPLATKGLGSRLLSCSDIYTHQQLQIQQCVPHCSRSDCDREHPRLLTDGSEICIIDCPQGFHLFSYLGMSVNDFCCSHILAITLNEQSVCTWDITAQSVVWFQDQQSMDWERDSCKRLVISRSDSPLRQSFATWGFCKPFFCSLLSR